MSRKMLEKIIGRAAMDSEFRHKMIKNPETALQDYNLTEEQILAIKAIPPDALDRFAKQLIQSIEKGHSKT